MRRYIAEWEGKKIILTEKDYEILMRRFDIRNFELKETFYYINKVACPLCNKYLMNRHCRGCTFNKFYKSGRPGCTKIMYQISEEMKVHQRLNLSSGQIIFPLKYEHEAKELIHCIRRLLMTRFQLMVNK